MIKYLKAFFRGLYKIIFNYPKIIKYSKHKEKYSIDERYAFAKKLVGIILKSFNVEVICDGLDKIKKDCSCLYVCNHQSVMDALVMVHVFDSPIVFVSKIEAKKYPFVGKVMESIDSIFMDRDNIRDAVKMIKTSKEYLNNNRDVCIFPEGTRTKDVNYIPGEYKPGSLKAAYETNKNIVSLVMNGSYKIFSRKYKNKIIVNAKVVDVFDFQVYQVKNTNELAKEIEEKTKADLIKIRQL